MENGYNKEEIKDIFLKLQTYPTKEPIEFVNIPMLRKVIYNKFVYGEITRDEWLSYCALCYKHMFHEKD